MYYLKLAFHYIYIFLDGEVGFIKIEDNQAWVRLQKEDTAKSVFEKFIDGKISVENVDLSGELPDEDVERKFLDEMADELMKRKLKSNKPKGGHKNFNRKRKGGGDGGPDSKRK